MKWAQAWTPSAKNVDRHLAILRGGIFVNAQGWDFGQIVELVNLSAAIPTLGSAAATIPTLGNVTIEV